MVFVSNMKIKISAIQNASNSRSLIELQIQRYEIIVQQPCPVPNGTLVLADFKLLPQDHILDTHDMVESSVIALVLGAVILFMLTFIVFVFNCRRIFKKEKKS